MPVSPHPATRREFLTAGLALSALALGGTGGSGAEANPRRPIRVGFLGISYSHFNSKYEVIRKSPDWELVGVCDPDPAVRARGPVGVGWLSATDLFAATEVVIVESAVQNHQRDALSALSAGRHVHVEKPPAATLAGLKALLSLAKRRQRLLQIGYMWRYNPGINRALEAARAGWLGDVYSVRATINTQAGPEQRREWARFRGGAMFEQGCHLIDPLIRLLGSPSQVSSHLQHAASGNDSLADNTVAVFEFQRALGIITSAPLQPQAGPHRFFEILGTNGTARVQPLEAPSLMLELATAAGPYEAGRQLVSLPPYGRYVDEFTALAQAVRDGTPLPFTPEVELQVHQALLQACQMR